MKFLFVCSGNTCRSPMAAAIARDLFLGETVEIHSAGVNAADGARPSREAVGVMRERGLDIANHRAKSVSQLDLDEFDAIVAMDAATARVLRKEFKAAPNKLARLDIDDPYGGGIETYRLCVQEIEAGLRRLFRGANEAFMESARRRP